MVSQTITIKNEQGLHMRPAGILVKELKKYASDVNLVFNEKKVNAKSVMNVIAACIKNGAEITVECSGEDEQDALKAAISVIESGLGE
ncbi:HPr family phosphocarrier protein [Anaerocolumna xylanovorans]|uniref:Phosphocarrier protein n=1 Tax=Anaerocolumna xylanovorans DSM 12503 TaxID=1121345 RepID=A0A1M7YD67_9FIRM|nr:HPr family phosphocarrier protein [Anaerocolumna xylanovorans]SHO50592.1 phosphocarrier protein [Anaerocolumna xylanovorans DSM 12503]